MLEDPESLNGLAGDVQADKLFYKMKESIGLRDIAISEEDIKAKYDAVLQEEEERAKLKQGTSASDEEE
jgi:hypothetical protein